MAMVTMTDICCGAGEGVGAGSPLSLWRTVSLSLIVKRDVVHFTDRLQNVLIALVAHHLAHHAAQVARHTAQAELQFILSRMLVPVVSADVAARVLAVSRPHDLVL